MGAWTGRSRRQSCGSSRRKRPSRRALCPRPRRPMRGLCPRLRPRPLRRRAPRKQVLGPLAEAGGVLRHVLRRPRRAASTARMGPPLPTVRSTLRPRLLHRRLRPVQGRRLPPLRWRRMLPRSASAQKRPAVSAPMLPRGSRMRHGVAPRQRREVARSASGSVAAINCAGPSTNPGQHLALPRGPGRPLRSRRERPPRPRQHLLDRGRRRRGPWRRGRPWTTPSS